MNNREQRIRTAEETVAICNTGFYLSPSGHQVDIRQNLADAIDGTRLYSAATYFGDSGKLEAKKLLERRAFRGDRLLGSFNAPVYNWIDFFTYTSLSTATACIN